MIFIIFIVYCPLNKNHSKYVFVYVNIYLGQYKQVRKHMDPRKHDRLISKDGYVNVKWENKRRNFLNRLIIDPFTTITNWSWTKLFLFFMLITLTSWLYFAILWALIVIYSHETCFSGEFKSIWISSILYSIETQQTIGYGSRVIREDCYLGIGLLMIQSALSVIIQAFMGGLFFAKLSLPRRRSETIVFSNKAVLSARDGYACFMCRVCDQQKTHIVQANFKMYLLQSKWTNEGELIPWFSQELKITNGRNNMLYLPIILEHRIDSRSPLYSLMTSYKSTHDFLTQAQFEIMVIIQGTIESTGASLHKQTSYTPDEIYADHFFVPMISDVSTKAKIDLTKIHDIVDYTKFKVLMQSIDFIGFNRNISQQTPTLTITQNDGKSSKSIRKISIKKNQNADDKQNLV